MNHQQRIARAVADAIRHDPVASRMLFQLDQWRGNMPLHLAIRAVFGVWEEIGQHQRAHRGTLATLGPTPPRPELNNDVYPEVDGHQADRVHPFAPWPAELALDAMNGPKRRRRKLPAAGSMPRLVMQIVDDPKVVQS